MVLKTANEFTGGADSELYAALAAGACVITANNRLAHHLHLGYARHLRATGRRVWETPDILPWSAFVQRSAEAARAHAGGRSPLTAAQEQWLWSELVTEYDPGFLCQDRAFAAQAAEAWQLLADYALPLPEAGGDRESEIFVALARAFMRRLAALGRDDAAHDPTRVAEAIGAGRIAISAQVLWAGFERLTPAQEAVKRACAARGAHVSVLPLPNRGGEGDARIFATATEELTAALLWARERIAREGHGRYALVVADLAAERRRVVRLAHEILASHPGAETVPYEISLGTALGEAPVVAAALRVWQLAGGTLAAGEAAALIQSPFLHEAKAERSARARCAYEMLMGTSEVDVTALARALRGGAPSAHAGFARLAGIVRRWPRRASASAWAGLLMGALSAVGWPGAAAREDYQAIAAVHDVLESFATLEAVAGGMSYARALGFVQGALGDRVFQPRGGDAPLQILGPLEAIGLTFDGLWVMNLHDRAWPAVRPPHPLLPLAFQRAHRLPHAFVEDDIRFAGRVLEDLVGAAPETILSSARHDASGALRPSRALIARGAVDGQAPAFVSRFGQAFAARAALEDYPVRAAPLDDARTGPFAAGLLAAQAACPFRAMAQYRLRADALDAPGYGLTPAVRGAVAHKVMEIWFGEFPEPRAWLALDTDARARRIAETVAAAQATAADDYARFPAAFVVLEARRMERLLAQFLEREEARPAFRVVEREKEVALRCGPLAMRGRIDRVDVVDGRTVLIDYKTGRMPAVDWMTDRPEYPQLLFYAVAEGPQVAGIAYAGLSARDGGYKAWTRDDALLPEATVVADWGQVTGAWPALLARLAGDFAAGGGAVDPLNGACEYCGREGFCRIDEGGGGGDDE
ncbi:MAG: PD-(D/E)XK nuclease family protein [Acidiferrobacter thiooxydans]